MRIFLVNFVKKLGPACVILCVLIGLGPSLAETLPTVVGPSSGNWVTLDEYEEHIDDPSKPSKEEIEKGNQADQGFTNSLFEQEKQRRATPQRPLDLPNMPVKSSRQDNGQNEAKHTPVIDEHIQLPSVDGKKIWVNIDELKTRDNDKKWADTLYHPLSKQSPVRLSVLPLSSVKPIPAARISRPRKTTPQRNPLSQDSEEKQSKEAEAKKGESKNNDNAKIPSQMFDQLNEYRRRQLEAMEMDRKTLAALKKALSEVGLTEKDGYVTELNRTGEASGDAVNKDSTKKR
ncbi:MAG: hypothetical protein EOM37_07690 [Proteobacteria bacterium]|jgi:hypothetical protein|nr:hypothetical protein [Alphaproteobacteria bacterium]NCC03912.1 hypothetical protein [Pseudomonadota bacterium]